MVIAMREFGRSLVTRASGRAAYAQIAETLDAAGDVVVFDFNGVDSITNSFADEVFGHLVADMGMDALRVRTTFAGIAPFWARIVRSAMDAREAQRRELVTC
ncbi:MAG: STAS-like domain-containing protein [Coriobacteriales bacterium]|nr:STAS-like domain-containing protein [Coriobacteriales bacterium]